MSDLPQASGGVPRAVEIDGVSIFPLTHHGDHRGFFREIHRLRETSPPLVQANHSHSSENALRGMHYHQAQFDLWYVTRGSIQVALADLRPRKAPVRTTIFTLTSDEPATLLVPPGVAHGYLALEEADLIYLVSEEYEAQDEFGIAWNDPTLGLEWRIEDPVLSDRDADNPRLDWALIPEF